MNRKRTLLLRLVVLGVFLLLSCSLPNGTIVPCETPTSIPVIDIPDGMLIQWWDSSNFAYVPPGEFRMGDAEASSGDNTPAHSVSLGGFWIQQTEVSNQMYAQCAAVGACKAPVQEAQKPYPYADAKYANHPVVNVTWQDARDYCTWIGARLPTEAEWELAARGTQGNKYPWGKDAPSCQWSDYGGCLDPEETIAVNTYPKGLSPYLLADMTGNVFEWVNDWYGAEYYASSPAQDPAGPVTGEKRVTRGSSYLSAAETLPLVLRSSLEPDKTRADLGFRCVLTGEAFTSPTLPLCRAFPYTPIEVPASAPRLNLQIPPGFSLEVYCHTDNQNNPHGSASIWLEQGVSVNTITFNSPEGDIFCTPDPNDPQKLNCSGSAFQPGKPVTVRVCNALPPAPVLAQPTCPVFYHFDEATNLCQYGISLQLPCAAPNVDIPGYGCLPSPQNGECLAGSFAGTYNGQPVCLPGGGPQCQCDTCQALCPQGLKPSDDKLCCAYPPDVAPVCPQGYSYDAALKVCTPDIPQVPACSHITSNVPTCQLDACLITTTTKPATGGPPISAAVCVSPCPVGPVNGGACTP